MVTFFEHLKYHLNVLLERTKVSADQAGVAGRDTRGRDWACSCINQRGDQVLLHQSDDTRAAEHHPGQIRKPGRGSVRSGWK